MDNFKLLMYKRVATFNAKFTINPTKLSIIIWQRLVDVQPGVMY